jgi:hypothetical protein
MVVSENSGIFFLDLVDILEVILVVMSLNMPGQRIEFEFQLIDWWL